MIPPTPGTTPSVELTSDPRKARESLTPGPIKAGPSSGHPVDKIKGRKPLLLLVEDDDSTRSALRKLFARLGWDVRSAMTVSDALTMLALEPEGIVLDLMLPDGDGLAVLRRVRSAGSSAKVVVTTGIDDPRRLDEVRRHLPDALLRKPMKFDDLVRALNVKRPV
jgi:CheY-like chemotaxis protein